METWLRVIANSMDQKFELASSQFDSLRRSADKLDLKYLKAGLKAKKQLGYDDELIEILEVQDEATLQELCSEPLWASFKICKDCPTEKVEDVELQLQLIKMYINDQYVRLNLMTEMLNKYNLTKEDVIIDSLGMNTDERNQERLKDIIEQYGFPTKKLVGKDAMDGVFMIIQHADKEWQKSQLQNVEKAVNKGDMDDEDYAYLYDRVKINEGEKQLYGTQFSKVDPANRTVTLAPTEDIENVDKRRMNLGMMPIEMYKEIVLKQLRLDK